MLDFQGSQRAGGNGYRDILTVQCENCNPRAWVEEGSSFFLVREGEEGKYPTEMQKAGCSADGEVEGKA